jgi:RNA polymerase sigma factor (sigma-70 family)
VIFAKVIKEKKTDFVFLLSGIFEKESKKLESYIRRLVPNREDAKDLVQDVFYNLIVGIGEIRDLEQVGAWLYRVARYKAIDFVRKKKAIPQTELEKNTKNTKDEDNESLFEWLASHSPPEQEQKMWEAAVWEVLESSLEQMPKDQREVFVKNELEGISLKEIAVQTNTNLNTVLSRKRYAVAQLKEALFTLYK